MSAIELSHLTRRYGRRRGVIDISFEVTEGEAFGFLGPNGAGKTTTIRVLMGFLRPSEGEARIFGRDCWSDAPLVHRDVSYVGGDPAYLGELPAAEQLDVLGGLRGLEPGSWRQLAERLELDPSVPIKKLSRGNRQKVGVVQAFMGHERLLVMDEPTTGLDPVMQREFLVLVAEARAAGRTVFLSSHNLPEVERCCDRVGIVREGRLVDVSSVQALLASHWRAVNLVLGAAPEPGTFDLPNVRVLAIDGQMVHLMIQGEVNELLRRLATLDVRDVAIATPDIEDVFLGFYEDRPTHAGPETAAGPEVSR
ncbi:MAG TPA: ABC transporter ATP-binding protein [Candidatus Limnocylindrales bacterium]